MGFEKEIGEIYRLKVPFEDIYTSVFLIKSADGNILVDCAATDKDVEEVVFPALCRLGVSLKDIKYLFITHKHNDHAGGISKILEYKPDIEVIDCKNPLSLESISAYELKGHTKDCIGVLDTRCGTLISGDGLQGYGVGKYRCSLESEEAYLQTIEKIRKDERIKNILFSHSYEPWNQDGAFGREEIKRCLQDCIHVLSEVHYD